MLVQIVLDGTRRLEKTVNEATALCDYGELELCRAPKKQGDPERRTKVGVGEDVPKGLRVQR
jgi:hypothetical protein